VLERWVPRGCGGGAARTPPTSTRQPPGRPRPAARQPSCDPGQRRVSRLATLSASATEAPLDLLQRRLSTIQTYRQLTDLTLRVAQTTVLDRQPSTSGPDGRPARNLHATARSRRRRARLARQRVQRPATQRPQHHLLPATRALTHLPAPCGRSSSARGPTPARLPSLTPRRSTSSAPRGAIEYRSEPGPQQRVDYALRANRIFPPRDRNPSTPSGVDHRATGHGIAPIANGKREPGRRLQGRARR
jgi:hypothetical protein